MNRRMVSPWRTTRGGKQYGMELGGDTDAQRAWNTACAGTGLCE